MEEIKPIFREFKTLDKQNHKINDYNGLLKAEVGLRGEMHTRMEYLLPDEHVQIKVVSRAFKTEQVTFCSKSCNLTTQEVEAGRM